jgi:hypothetical protein
MKKINKHHQLHLLLFGSFAGLLLIYFVYAGTNGIRIFGSDGNKQAWNSSGPGYHK